MNERVQKILFNENQDKVEEKPNLTEEEIQKRFSSLLQHSKVIRDSVHGDIWITKTEIAIIDTQEFQRLRGIKQLGPTDLVYPSAKHTRFEHSIGALYIAQQIIDSINKNFKMGFSKILLPPEDIFITRIVALIHDLAHLPYGHTIENEGNLFGGDKQWLDAGRRTKILEKVLPIVKDHLFEKKIPNDKIEKILKDIEKILIAEETGEDEIHNLSRPYIADIVGNTICADLLDYLKRDSYNTGLKMVYDPRILSYFVIHPYSYEKNGKENQKPRVAILLERRKGILREDILSYCLDLLRLRYSLAEKVYYHRVKSIFSAVVIKMVYCGLKGKILTKDDLQKLSDDALLYRISSYTTENFEKPPKTSENTPKVYKEDDVTLCKSKFSTDNDDYIQACKHLADALLKRNKYRIIHFVLYETEELLNMVKDYSDPYERYQLERKFEDLFDFPPGTVVVYSTKLDKGKDANIKLLRGIFGDRPIIKKLSEIGKEPVFQSTIGQEISTMENRYKRLWKFYVLIDSMWGDKRDEKMLKGACEEILQKKVGENVIGIRLAINEMEITTSQMFKARQEIAVEIDPLEIKGKEIDKILKTIKGMS